MDHLTVSSSSGVWGSAPAEIKFGAFWPSNVTSGGIKFTKFPENQLTTAYAFFYLFFVYFTFMKVDIMWT